MKESLRCSSMPIYGEALNARAQGSLSYPCPDPHFKSEKVLTAQN